MPSSRWRCMTCGAMNPPRTDACRECQAPASMKFAHAHAKSSVVAVWVVRVGILIAFGPIAGFLFVSLFSSSFGSNTLLF